MSPRYLFLAHLSLGLFLGLAPATASACASNGVHVQVLGSGGPGLQDNRAASGYLIWVNGKARVLVDVGSGSALRFIESTARISDLDVILLTQLGVDHSADLPALINATRTEDRERALDIYGPDGNKFMPSTVALVRIFFDNTRGAYRYLGEFLSPLGKNTYKLKPHDVSLKGNTIETIFNNERLRVSAVAIKNNKTPALAWRVDVAGKRIVFSGDDNGSNNNLDKLAQNADLLLVNHGALETASANELREYSPPSRIGRLAQSAQAKQLVLSHRNAQTLGKETNSLAVIKKTYEGSVIFADDLVCFQP